MQNRSGTGALLWCGRPACTVRQARRLRHKTASSRLLFGLVAAAVGLVFLLTGCTGRAVVPTAYDTYNCKDGNFKIQYPAGWQVEPSGQGSYASVKFTSGGAEITVETSLAGSLVGEMASSGMLKFIAPGQPENLPPVATVHLREKESFQDGEGVEEKEPVVVQTGLGEGRKSEFQGKSAFGAETRGYRVTTLSRDYRIRVVCKCPASEWDALRPAFDKVIESLGIGKPTNG